MRREGGGGASYALFGAAEIEIAIAAAGGIETLIALLGSPTAEVQKVAAGALLILARNGVCRGGGVRRRERAGEGAASYARCVAAENAVVIAAAGGIAPLIALLGSPSAHLQNAAAGVLLGLAFNGVCRVRGGGGAR